jgi:surface antigen
VASQNGAPTPSYQLGDAYQWGANASAHGIPVNGTPTIGAVAWWNQYAGHGPDGHVAYVEAINGDGTVTISEDVFSAGPFSWKIIPAGQPTGYIHFKDASNLYFIKTRNTGSGRVEVHSATAVSGYQGADVHAATWFDTADQSNGYFQMVGPDLYFIKTRNTGSGNVEVHSRTSASGYQSGIDVATWFSSADQNNGWFQMEDVDYDGRQDLVFIKTHNTGTFRVEVHWRTAASGYQSGLDVATVLSEADANNGWFQLVNQDLVFIKSWYTGSGRIEVHWRTAASGYQSGPSLATWFSTADQSNGWFQMLGKELFFIKTRNTGSTQVEVHSATSVSGYQAAGLHSTTWFGTADQNNGWFQASVK